MKRLTGAFIVAAVFVLVSPGSHLAVAAPPARAQAAPESGATDVSAQRRIRRHDRSYVHRRPVQPYYYARPTYYRPYPYSAPVPFFLGIGFAPSSY